MAGIQINYSKEIAKELGKIAVYLPGEQVEVGDVIQFPYGKKGLFGSRRAPQGSFKKITSLDKLGIEYDSPELSNRPDSYHFMSNNSVEQSFDAEGKAESNAKLSPKTKGYLNLKFKSEGAIYFLALNCDKKQFNDLVSLEKAINTHGKDLPWEDTYLVTSVTIAKKALVIQSNSKNSGVSIGGNIDSIPTNMAEVKIDIAFKITQRSGDLFIKDWSDDVTVFMDLVKFDKKVFGTEKNRGYTSQKEGKYLLTAVNVNELV